jgi:hypothetical protein
LLEGAERDLHAFLRNLEEAVIRLRALPAVPGTYEAPASSAYLYYTAEDMTWARPVAITIDR